MKESCKKFKNFSKLLYNINFNQTHYIRNSKTFAKREIKKNSNHNSFSNLIEPEVEYVSKLNFYSPEATIDHSLLNNINTMPNFSPSLKIQNKNIRAYIEEHKLQTFEENKFTNQIKENKLENKRKDLEKKINKIKTLINSLNEELSKIITETENLKLDFEVLQNNKTISIIEKNFKKKIKANELFLKSKKNSLPFLSNKTFSTDKNKEKKNKINTLLSQHKEDMKIKKNFVFLKIKQLNEKKKEIVQKIKACENDMKNFKEERNKIKKELLIHYHNLLLEGKDIRKEGLSWIIKSIWNLKSNVLLSYLPKFLDEQSISFLFSYSMKKIKMHSIYKIIQELSVKLKQKEEKNEKRSLSKENTIDDESNTIETNIFDYNGYNNTSKESFDQEENKKDHNINNINIKKNREWLKGIIKTNSYIFKENNKISSFNRPKDVIYDIIQKNKKNKHIYDRKNNFRKSIYNKTNNTDFQLITRDRNDFQEDKAKYFLELFNNVDENKIKNCIFNKNLLKENNLYNKENKIKLTDFENIYKNSRKELDGELLELYNARKALEKKYLKLKNDIEVMVKNELDRLNKCFYREDYEAKYNIDQKSLISAIVGEDNGRNEYNRQIIENKKYFKTLKELRRGILNC